MFEILHEGFAFKFLRTLDPNKATGPDGMGARILKVYAKEITWNNTHILNVSIGKMFSLLLETYKSNSRLYNKDNSKLDVSNHRPVSSVPLQFCRRY